MASKKTEKFEGEWNRLFGKHFQLNQNGPSQLNLHDECISFMNNDPNNTDDKRGPSLEQTEAIEWLKVELNGTKSLLNDYDIKVWRTHTNFTNLCSNISRTVRKNLNAELCTNAWLKFATILNTYDLIPLRISQNEQSFGSVHLCEAPGAFITYLNHHLKKKHPDIKWQWIGASLNPYYEGNNVDAMINDDRFIKETLPNWEFGVDFTGDIMDIENIKNLQKRSKTLHSVDLVTADGGIDCSDDPCMQEVLIAPLLYWEIVAALHVLSPGGSFVVKVFTVLEKFTISMIYILCCAFKEVHFCKPGPSKPGNSEVYVICKDFYGSDKLDPSFIECIMKSTETKNYTQPLIAMKFMSREFIGRVIDCEEYFISHQIEAIQYNIKTFNNVSKGKRYFIHLAKEYFNEEFIRSFQLDFIDSKDHLAYSNTKMKSSVPNHYTKEHSHNFHVGNFYERQSKRKIKWNERVQYEDEIVTTPKETHWFQPTERKALTSCDIDKWKPIVGKGFEKIKSTQFCCNYVLLDLFEARESLFYAEEKGVKQTVSEALKDEHEILELLEIIGKGNYAKTAVVKNKDKNLIDVGIIKNASLDRAKEIFKCGENSEKCNEIQSSIYCTSEKCSDHENEDHPVVQSFDISENSIPTSLGKITEFVGQDEPADVLVTSALNQEQCTDHESSQNMLLINLILTFNVLKNGGMLVCEISDIFSNFNGGVIHILSKVFDKFTIFKPICLHLSPRRYIIGCGYIGKNEGLSNYLLEIYKMKTVQNNEILHLIPIQNILEDDFLRYLRDVNELHAKQEMHSIIKTQK